MRIQFRTLGLAALSLVCFQNCSSPVGFTEEASTTTPSTTIKCSDELSKVTVPVKVLFVIDKSGSNASTDPTMNLRGGAIQNFFDRYKAMTNFSWGLELFNNSQARSLIGTSSANYFSSNTTTVQNAINTFYSSSDVGGTPYRAALQLAISAISGDSSTTSTTKYFVVFISDGVPDPAVADNILAQDISTLMAIHLGRVALSTIYYGSVSTDAMNRLQTMATLGTGKFLNANSGGTTSFQIDDVVVIPGVICE